MPFPEILASIALHHFAAFEYMKFKVVIVNLIYVANFQFPIDWSIPLLSIVQFMAQKLILLCYSIKQQRWYKLYVCNKN
jgi:hypothetical protein